MLRLYFSTPLLFAHLLFKPSAKSYWLCLSSSRRLLLNIVSPTVIKPLVQAIFRPEMNYHNSFLSDLVPLSLQSFSSWSQSASQWVYVPCLLKSLQRHFISVKTKVVKNITNILGSDSSFPFFPSSETLTCTSSPSATLLFKILPNKPGIRPPKEFPFVVP